MSVALSQCCTVAAVVCWGVQDAAAAPLCTSASPPPLPFDCTVRTSALLQGALTTSTPPGFSFASTSNLYVCAPHSTASTDTEHTVKHNNQSRSMLQLGKLTQQICASTRHTRQNTHFKKHHCSVIQQAITCKRNCATQVHIYTHIYIRIHIYTHTYIYVHIYVHTLTYIYAGRRWS